MLIIEGRTGKIKEVKKELEGMDLSEVLFINASNVDNPFMVFDRPILYLVTADNEDVPQLINNLLADLDEDNPFNTLVFYVNCDKADIDTFIHLEQKIKNNYSIQKCILTVQNNDLEQIYKYNI